VECVTLVYQPALTYLKPWHHVLFGVIFATSLGSMSMLHALSRRRAKKKKEEEEAPPAGYGAEPQLKSNLVHFSLKI